MSALSDCFPNRAEDLSAGLLHQPLAFLRPLLVSTESSVKPPLPRADVLGRKEHARIPDVYSDDASCGGWLGPDPGSLCRLPRWLGREVLLVQRAGFAYSSGGLRDMLRSRGTLRHLP